MLVSVTDTITLTRTERMELERRVASRTGRAEDARRARAILLLAQGHTWDEACDRVPCRRGFLASWSRRFEEQRIAGLYSRHLGHVATVLTAELEARILDVTRRRPPYGATHWSRRKLGEHLDVSHMMVARVWRKHGLRPHRIERYMASNDPDFEKKAADMIGLFLNPPAHAAIFCVDEKTAIRALDRKDPVLPLSPGRLERHGFEYCRHGTLLLHAAFNTKTGEVLGKAAARHTCTEFVAFLADIVVKEPRDKEIHVIADNLSTHMTEQVATFLKAHPKVHLHFTPTYSSWLNQVELWFGKIERDVIARGVFASVTDLKTKLMHYIRQYNKAPRTVTWKYADSSRHISTHSVGTGHQRRRAQKTLRPNCISVQSGRADDPHWLQGDRTPARRRTASASLKSASPPAAPSAATRPPGAAYSTRAARATTDVSWTGGLACASVCRPVCAWHR